MLAPDLPGYGESATGTPWRVLSVEQLADVLDLWLSACAIDKAAFIGNSYGCQILTTLTVRHPQRVERLVLMASDTAPECGPPHGGIKGCSISLQVDNVPEAERLYEALSEGGSVQMELQATFWATRFAMLTDRFGVSWMINCMVDSQQG